jgi:hypothetical protein
VDTVGVLGLFVGIVGGVFLTAARATRRYGAPLLLVSIACAGWLGYRDVSYRSLFKRMPMGSAKSELVAVLGNPTKTTDGSTDFWGSPLGRRDQCSTVLWYGAFFTADVYEFCYSREAKLVFKYDYSSY